MKNSKAVEDKDLFDVSDTDGEKEEDDFHRFFDNTSRETGAESFEGE